MFQPHLLFCGTCCGSKLIQQAHKRAASSSHRLSTLFRQFVQQLIASDQKQPRAKLSSLAVRSPAANRFRHGQHDVLHKFFGIRILKTATNGKAIDEGFVNRHKFLPCIAIFCRRKSQNQTGSGFWHPGHRKILPMSVHTTAVSESFTGLLEK